MLDISKFMVFLVPTAESIAGEECDVSIGTKYGIMFKRGSKYSIRGILDCNGEFRIDRYEDSNIEPLDRGTVFTKYFNLDTFLIIADVIGVKIEPTDKLTCYIRSIDTDTRDEMTKVDEMIEAFFSRKSGKLDKRKKQDITPLILETIAFMRRLEVNGEKLYDIE